MEAGRKTRKEYVKYAKVFPLAEFLDVKIPPKWYRRFVGSIEIICGLALALIPSNKVKHGANVILLFLMLMAVYSHYMVNDKFERIAPALVFFFMLTGRLVIDYQLKRKQEPPTTGNGEIRTEEKVRKVE
ncbi:hypothetical protein RUM44_013533 [Polyplax serrata]|uniref:Novel acetylcholine receptor chaperone n=1 Tax=Polyplax serrata TaxID=468196 RepID=A0ABR1BEF3_POLSC